MQGNYKTSGKQVINISSSAKILKNFSRFLGFLLPINIFEKYRVNKEKIKSATNSIQSKDEVLM